MVEAIAKQVPQDEAEVRFPTLLDMRGSYIARVNSEYKLDVCLLICSAISFMVVIREQI